MFYRVRRGHLTPREVAGRLLILRSESEGFVVRPSGRLAKKRVKKQGLGNRE